MFSMKSKIILLGFGIFIVGTGLSLNDRVYAYGECSEYGIMAMYDYFTDSCKCMSGYVFGKGILGGTQCVSADSVCRDKYGYNSRYNSLDGLCECSYGYVLGKDSIGRTACISEDQACKNQYGFNARSNYLGNCECGYGYDFGKDALGRPQCVSLDSLCTDQLGYNARYNSLHDECECRSGYVIDSYGQCSRGDSVCRNKHGMHASYNVFDTVCECDDGYTFDDSNKCVEKQNNAYFTLKEINTDEREAIIRSDYDFRYYLVSYGLGCLDFSFERYLNRKIVVNLGTDFNVDIWDRIVLQDHDQVCDITRVRHANSSTTLEPEEEETFYFIPQANPTPTASPSPLFTPSGSVTVIEEQEFQLAHPKEEVVVVTSENSSTIVQEEINIAKEKQNNSQTTPWYRRIFSFFFGIFR
jgi:hypothetical protein